MLFLAAALSLTLLQDDCTGLLQGCYNCFLALSVWQVKGRLNGSNVGGQSHRLRPLQLARTAYYAILVHSPGVAHVAYVAHRAILPLQHTLSYTVTHTRPVPDLCRTDAGAVGDT